MVFNWYLTKALRSYYKLVHFINFTWRERSIHSLLAVFIDYSLYARFNQSILKEISPKYSLEGLMLELKLQYFGHLMQRTDSCEKTLMLGKTEARRGREWQRMRWQDGSGSWRWTVKLCVLQSMGSQRVGHDWATDLNWTELTEI